MDARVDLRKVRALEKAGALFFWVLVVNDVLLLVIAIELAFVAWGR